MKNNRFLYVIITAVLGFLLYANVLKSPFQFDDFWFIVDNHTIRDIRNIPLIWEGVLAYPTRFVAFYTFALNYHFHQLDVFGYHLVNILIHLLNTALVYWLVLQILHAKNKFKTEGYSTTALFTALLFLTHPVQTQAVTFISQRFTCLAALFYLLAVCLYLKGRLTAGKNPLFFAGAGTAAILGMLTKEFTLTLPLMILLIEWFFFLPKESKKGWFKRVLFISVFLMIIPVTYSLDVETVFSPKYSLSHLGDILTPYTYLLTEIRVLITYIRLLFLPVNQNLDYDYPMYSNIFDPAVLLSVLLLSSLMLTAFRLRKTHPMITIGIFWFFLTLSVNFIPRQNVIAEHNLYLPSIGFFIIVSVSAFQFIRNPKTAKIALSAFILVMSLSTIKRNYVWQNEIRLWEDVVSKSPKKYTVYQNLSRAYVNAGKMEKAQMSLAKALRINPNFELAYNDRGNIFFHFGNLDKAFEDFNQAIAIDPNLSQAYNNRALIYQKKNMYESALKEYNLALKISPHYSQAINNRGSLYLLLKEYELAKEDFQKAMRLDPHDPKIYLNYAVACQYNNETPEALKYAREAQRMGHPKAAHFIERVLRENEGKN